MNCIKLFAGGSEGSAGLKVRGEEAGCRSAKSSTHQIPIITTVVPLSRALNP